jgi:hypothetical protein
MHKENRLPWRLEAFREYLPYETLQPAAAVLQQFEGELISTTNPKILQMQDMLKVRTNKGAWIPNRSGSEAINWNVEGDFTRNKGRLLTSMLILFPKEFSEDKIQLTEFGHALASGRVSKGQFYDFIISKFKYPHPAWPDNWDAWKGSGKTLLPFIYILQALVALYKKGSSQAFLTTEEIADYLHPNPDHKSIKNSVTNILIARENKIDPITKRSDEIHRKITDIMGFLCFTDYCFYEGKKIFLNLMDVHEAEHVNFLGKRNGQDKMARIASLIKSAIENETGGNNE